MPTPPVRTSEEVGHPRNPRKPRRSRRSGTESRRPAWVPDVFRRRNTGRIDHKRGFGESCGSAGSPVPARSGRAPRVGFSHGGHRGHRGHRGHGDTLVEQVSWVGHHPSESGRTPSRRAGTPTRVDENPASGMTAGSGCSHEPFSQHFRCFQSASRLPPCSPCPPCENGTRTGRRFRLGAPTRFPEAPHLDRRWAQGEASGGNRVACTAHARTAVPRAPPVSSPRWMPNRSARARPGAP